jgi:hypothetical protein
MKPKQNGSNHAQKPVLRGPDHYDDRRKQSMARTLPMLNVHGKSQLNSGRKSHNKYFCQKTLIGQAQKTSDKLRKKY